jgi:hypothetical protein
MPSTSGWVLRHPNMIHPNQVLEVRFYALNLGLGIATDGFMAWS